MIDDHRVHEWAVPGDAYNYICGNEFCRADVALQYVALATSKTPKVSCRCEVR